MAGTGRTPPPDPGQQQHDGFVTDDLHDAAVRNDTERVKSLLDSERANLLGLLRAGTTDKSFTVLHLAGGEGHLAVVELILKTIHCKLSEADIRSVINARDYLDCTPLHYAVRQQHWSVVKAFLSSDCKGAVDVNTRDKNGFTPLLSLLMGGKLQGGKLHVESLAALLNCPDIEVGDVNDSNDVSSASQQQTGGTIRPLELIVGVKRDSLAVLDSVWDLLDNENVEAVIVEEITTQIKSILPVKLRKVDQPGNTVIHYAAFAGLPALMGILIRKVKYLRYINEENDIAQTPLHLASLRGDLATVKFLDRQPTLQGAREDKDGHTAVEMAFELDRREILRVLMQRSDVTDYIGMQHEDRSVFVDGTNAILVGAALIASITFAGWLQPPLGYQPYFQYSIPNSPPGTYEQYAAITEHTSVKVFWLFNSLSFYFSIAAILTGAGAAVPRGDLFLRAEVKRLRGSLFLTSFVFSWAVLFVLGAFTASGFASLPPITNYELFMILTLVVGFIVCYLTFSFSRTSDPYFYIRYTKYVDPGFLFSSSVRFIKCNPRSGYDSVTHRIRDMKEIYWPFEPNSKYENSMSKKENPKTAIH